LLYGALETELIVAVGHKQIMGEDYEKWQQQFPVSVNLHPSKGRQMLASKELPAGSVLLADSPYCWVVDDAAKEIVCQHCFLEKDPAMEEFVTCEDCKQVYYCCEECRDLDYAQHGLDECKIFAALETVEYTPAIITEMKLLVRTLSRKSVENADYQVKIPNDNDVRYSDYVRLITNRENFSQDTIGSLDYWICDYIRRLGEWVGERKEDNIELLDIILRNRCNAFYIQGRLRDEAVTNGMVGTSRGCGIYVRNSFFNHSCQPNVNYWVVENSLRVECTSASDVVAGDELTISYIDTALDLESRRAKLQESYLFTCDCPRCSREEAEAAAAAETPPS